MDHKCEFCLESFVASEELLSHTKQCERFKRSLIMFENLKKIVPMQLCVKRLENQDIQKTCEEYIKKIKDDEKKHKRNRNTAKSRSLKINVNASAPDCSHTDRAMTAHAEPLVTQIAVHGSLVAEEAERSITKYVGSIDRLSAIKNGQRLPVTSYQPASRQLTRQPLEQSIQQRVQQSLQLPIQQHIQQPVQQTLYQPSQRPTINLGNAVRTSYPNSNQNYPNQNYPNQNYPNQYSAVRRPSVGHHYPTLQHHSLPNIQQNSSPIVQQNTMPIMQQQLRPFDRHQIQQPQSHFQPQEQRQFIQHSSQVVPNYQQQLPFASSSGPQRVQPQLHSHSNLQHPVRRLSYSPNEIQPQVIKILTPGEVNDRLTNNVISSNNNNGGAAIDRVII